MKPKATVFLCMLEKDILTLSKKMYTMSDIKNITQMGEALDLELNFIIFHQHEQDVKMDEYQQLQALFCTLHLCSWHFYSNWLIRSAFINKYIYRSNPNIALIMQVDQFHQICWTAWSATCSFHHCGAKRSGFCGGAASLSHNRHSLPGKCRYLSNSTPPDDFTMTSSRIYSQTATED